MDGFYNNKSQFQPKPKAETIQPDLAKVPQPQPNYDDMAWLGSTQDCVKVVKDGMETCRPEPIRSGDIYGKDWLLAGFVNANENHYFTAGNEIKVAMSGTGWGFVEMPHQVHSRKVEDDGHIQGIATTRDALRDQYFEPQSQNLNPLSIRGGDYKGQGRAEGKLLPWGSPVSYKHKDESAKIVAWEIHSGRFIPRGDPGAIYLGLIILIRATDLPKFKIYADGWGASDVIFYEPSWFQIIWEKILSTKGSYK